MGIFFCHWAIQVGDTWYEVAGIDGPIQTRSEGEKGHVTSSNAVAEYKIQTSTGPSSASEATYSPIRPITLAWLCTFWLFNVALLGDVEPVFTYLVFLLILVRSFARLDPSLSLIVADSVIYFIILMMMASGLWLPSSKRWDDLHLAVIIFPGLIVFGFCRESFLMR